MRNLVRACLTVIAWSSASGFAAAHAAESEPASSTFQSSAGDAEMAAKQARLGFHLLQALANGRASPATVLNSPASVAAVFAFLDLTADTGMHRALVKTFGFKPEQAATALDNLRSAARELAAAPGKGPLAFADGVFIDPAGKVRPAALEQLRAAGVEARDAELGTQAGIDAVNAWVSQRTGGLIPSILGEPLANAILVAVNALYFKDEWSEPFDAKLTRPESFHLVDGASAAVPMMHLGSVRLPVRQDDRFVGVTLPYRTSGYSLTVVTTKNTPAALGDFAPVAEWLAGDGFQPSQGEVSLSLPKFDVSDTAELLPALLDLGLAEGISPTAFAALSEKPLQISAVVQKTVIKVYESGTEAAAATALVAPGAAAPPRQVEILEVKVDKPFIFALRDDRHGLILMTGYVGNPGGS